MPKMHFAHKPKPLHTLLKRVLCLFGRHKWVSRYREYRKCSRCGRREEQWFNEDTARYYWVEVPVV
jgi:hypothetical protein